MGKEWEKTAGRGSREGRRQRGNGPKPKHSGTSRVQTLGDAICFSPSLPPILVVITASVQANTVNVEKQANVAEGA